MYLNREAFAKRLKQTRKEKWKTVVSFGDFSKLPYSSLYTYERGVTLPSSDTADILARNLGVNLQWLLTEEGPKERTNYEREI